MMKGKIAVSSVNAYGGVEIWLYPFLTSELDEGEWSASHSGRFTHGEKEMPVPIKLECRWVSEAVGTF
jgi:hypothetical protein